MQIKSNNISYVYNEKLPTKQEALKCVNLDIKSGEFVAIVGKTGSGKSTYVQTLNGLCLPKKGYNLIDDFIITSNKKIKKAFLKEKGKEIKKQNRNISYIRRDIGLVFQFPEYQLFSETILKDVMFGPKNFKFAKDDIDKFSKDALKSVGITEDYFEKSPFELSGGEKRRVAIASILSFKPKILVLDEPTAGLDGKGKEEIMRVIKEYNDLGNTVILITHDMDVVLNYAKRVVVFKDGEIIKDENPDELFNEENLKDYSLEIPALYKFKKLLKNRGFKGNLNEIKDFSSLIKCIKENYNE